MSIRKGETVLIRVTFFSDFGGDVVTVDAQSYGSGPALTVPVECLPEVMCFVARWLTKEVRV